jgi:hypothetical protein
MQSRLAGAACALACLFGVASLAEAGLVVPTDLLPGDQYHVIFVSTTLTTATSSDIDTYD